MKVISFLFLVVCSYSVFAEPAVTLILEATQPGETIVGSIDVGSFVSEIDELDFSFYEGRKKVFFEYDTYLQNDTLYWYAYTTREGNFSLGVGPFLYRTNEGVLAQSTLSYSFILASNELTGENVTGTKILAIKPGFLKQEKTKELRLINKGTLPLEVLYSEKTIALAPDEEYPLEIDATNTDRVTLQSYREFPIVIMEASTEEPILPRAEDLGVLTWGNETFDANVPSEKTTQYELTLTNTGTKKITNISVTSDLEFLKISTPYIESLETNASVTVLLDIAAEGRGNRYGNIETRYEYGSEQGIIDLPVTLLIVPIEYDPQKIVESPLTCEEEGGAVCETGLLCNGDATFSADGKYCCLGTCVEGETEPEKRESNKGMYIGVGILLVIVLVGYLVYRKQRKMKTEKKDPMKTIGSAYPTTLLAKQNNKTTQQKERDGTIPDHR